MRFLNKPVLTIAVLVSFGLPNAGAFSMMGPPAAWQIPALQYQVGGDIGSPQNLGEEYRVNLPTVFYAMDQTFLDYFGLRGAQAVDEAFGVFNALPPVSQLSESLEEYPLEASRLNYRAASLQLMDVKTTLMTAIAESLALDDPIRWNWCVRAIIPDTGCTAQNQGQTYVVIKRSFDPVTWEPSSYINGALYTYVLVFLGTSCGNGDAIELTVDPLAFNYSAIASWGSSAFKFGTFFTGLTRDDVGGLRYLYRPSNYNWEQISPEVQVVANAGSPWTPVGATNAVPSTLALRQGIDKVRYEKRSFDSLLGTFFTPFTNTFSTTIVTNGTAYQQVIGRAVLAPDVLISAGDITQNGFGGPLIVRTVGNPYNSVTTVTGVNGPGSRSPITQFILNKVGPVWTGHTPEFIRENQVTFNYAWGSFDGTTNAPVIYPSGRSIRDLEALVLQGSGSSGGGPFTPAP